MTIIQNTPHIYKNDLAAYRATMLYSCFTITYFKLRKCFNSACETNNRLVTVVVCNDNSVICNQ